MKRRVNVKVSSDYFELVERQPYMSLNWHGAFRDDPLSSADCYREQTNREHSYFERKPQTPPTLSYYVKSHGKHCKEGSRWPIYPFWPGSTFTEDCLLSPPEVVCETQPHVQRWYVENHLERGLRAGVEIARPMHLLAWFILQLPTSFPHTSPIRPLQTVWLIERFSIA